VDSPDPRLKKLVEGAQKHVKPVGYSSLYAKRSLNAIRRYEDWKNSLPKEKSQVADLEK
jgi:hypothetical protein